MTGQKRKLGREGERLAARALMDAGYEIVYRNYSHPPYELDIIAVKGDTLVVAEVKSFHSPPLGAAEFRIGKKKQRALYNGIDAFLAENSQFSDYNVRIDIFIVDFSTFPANLTHYPGVIFE
ncbi:MAG TPA: YraN family protein [Caldithrix abyssi]|uniref:UPF0102 protein ENJ10_09695 n=1 Tax=Caldithrix abyssi TaxID=187145 RepID=A0A7V1M0C5_CALAY|nr:YraN family protein [Caldithrix abyssi]